MKKFIDIEIHPDGRIHAETVNMIGEECLIAPEILAALVKAEIVDSRYLPNYYQTENTNGLAQENVQRQES
jgi:hypothetical protein